MGTVRGDDGGEPVLRVPGVVPGLGLAQQPRLLTQGDAARRVASMPGSVEGRRKGPGHRHLAGGLPDGTPGAAPAGLVLPGSGSTGWSGLQLLLGIVVSLAANVAAAPALAWHPVQVAGWPRWRSCYPSSCCFTGVERAASCGPSPPVWKLWVIKGIPALPEPDEERLRTAVARSSASLCRQILLYVNDGDIPQPDRRGGSGGLQVNRFRIWRAGEASAIKFRPILGSSIPEARKRLLWFCGSFEEYVLVIPFMCHRLVMHF